MDVVGLRFAGYDLDLHQKRMPELSSVLTRMCSQARRVE